jgi:hypothetical protein
MAHKTRGKHRGKPLSDRRCAHKQIERLTNPSVLGGVYDPARGIMCPECLGMFRWFREPGNMNWLLQRIK